VRSTGRREAEAARRADGVSRAVGCIRESGRGDGALVSFDSFYAKEAAGIAVGNEMRL
jgi:hypothetical protein